MKTYVNELLDRINKAIEIFDEIKFKYPNEIEILKQELIKNSPSSNKGEFLLYMFYQLVITELISLDKSMRDDIALVKKGLDDDDLFSAALGVFAFYMGIMTKLVGKYADLSGEEFINKVSSYVLKSEGNLIGYKNFLSSYEHFMVDEVRFINSVERAIEDLGFHQLPGIKGILMLSFIEAIPEVNPQFLENLGLFHLLVDRLLNYHYSSYPGVWNKVKDVALLVEGNMFYFLFKFFSSSSGLSDKENKA